MTDSLAAYADIFTGRRQGRPSDPLLVRLRHALGLRQPRREDPRSCAVVGRILPSLLLTVVLGAALVFGVLFAFPYGYPTTVRPTGTGGDPYAIIVSSAFLAPDGSVVSFVEAASQAPAELAEADRAEWVYANYPSVSFVIPGQDMPAVQAREALLIRLVGLASAVVLSLVVVRRRPY